MSTEDYLITGVTTFSIETPPVDTTGNTLVGFCYLILSLAVLMPYVVVLKVILTDNEIKFKPGYRIMFQLGLADILQLVSHAVAGVMTIFQAPSSTSWFTQVIGCAELTGWWVYIWFTMVLALNRLVQICVPRYLDLLFGNKSTLVWIVLGWLVGLFVVIECLTPFVEFTYYSDMYTWGYGTNKLNNMAQTFELYVVMGEMIVSGICYCIICTFVVYTRSQPSSGNVDSAGMKMEIQVMLQAFILFFYTTLLQFVWHNYYLVFEDSKWVFMGINVMWIVNGGINPFIYLIFNRTLKKKVFKIINPEIPMAVTAVHPAP